MLENENRMIDVMASFVAKKHHISIEEMNNVFKEGFKELSVELEDVDLLFVYDRFIESNKRMATGSYYTPYPLAEQMVRMAYCDYFSDKLEIPELFFYSPYFIEDSGEFVSRLKSLKIGDIACGSGVFLIAALRVMKSYYDALKVKYDIEKMINQVYGLDIQEEPLVILKLLLFDFAMSEGVSVSTFNVYLGDTILTERDLSFDMILGNPPYVGEKGNKALFDNYKHLPGYEARMDLFYFFIYKGYDYLKSDGVLMYITTNYFITADGASKLRKFMKEKLSFIRVINLDECKMFSEAKGMHNLIYSFTKNKVSQTKINIIPQTRIKSLDVLHDVLFELPHRQLFSETGNIILYEKPSYYHIIKKMLENTMMNLGQLVKINQGIVSGADKVTRSVIDKKISAATVEKYSIEVGQPIYVFDEKTFESDYLRPFYKNSHIESYGVKMDNPRWILYLKNDDLCEEDREYEHLLPFKELLSNRREVQKGARDWYALQWSRDQRIFEGAKIIVPQRANMNYFGYTEKPFYSSADVYYLTEGPLKFLLGILNSKLYYFWLYNRGKRKGRALELYANPLAKIPIPMMDYGIIEEHVNNILTDVGDLEAIDQILYSYFQLTDIEIQEVELLYNRGRKFGKEKNN